LLAKFFREFELRRPQRISVSKMKTVSSAHLLVGIKNFQLVAILVVDSPKGFAW